jgi:hypothetical protein
MTSTVEPSAATIVDGTTVIFDGSMPVAVRMAAAAAADTSR